MNGYQVSLSRDKLPFTFVANVGGEAVGSAQLKFREMAEKFPEKELWFGGVCVASQHRGLEVLVMERYLGT